MNKKAITLSIIGIIISFIGGFLLANALNRSELDALRAENSRLKSAPQESDEFTLTDEEIRRKINESEQNQDNFDFQKNLGIALYRYAAMKQETKYLPDVVTILQRAAKLNSNDLETQIALGNAHLDLGQINKDNQAFVRAREFYANALKIKPDNADAQNDLGLTYFLVKPSEDEKAIAEFQKALQINPNHEKSLENLVRVYLAQGKNKEAEVYLHKLKKINPKNDFLAQFEAQIAQPKQNQ